MNIRRFSTDKQALEFLERRGFTIERGVIKNPKGRRDDADVSEMEAEAIGYLCDEWDYCTI